MRPIIKTTLCFVVAAAVAAPACAASSNYYLKLGDVKGESAARASGGHKDWIEIQSWSWGAATAGAWNGTIKGGAASTAKFGAVSGAHRDDSVAAPAVTEKRQHGWMPVAKPLDRGALRVKVKFPWLECKVGAAFSDAMLQNDAGRYEFKDAIITGCAPDSVSLNYAKVTVRGWDPATK
jgi:hypothetical protein